MELFSEPFSRTGNMAAEGFRKLLGKPALGLLQTVLRESLQNSLDAAKLEKGPQVVVRLRELDEKQQRFLCESVLAELPENDSSRNAISQSLDSSPVRVLEICDFNTTGLGGPLRADESIGDEDPDFVNFLRNIGAAQTTIQGGGTYGYGKTSLYAISRCATILVDTVTTAYGERTRRFMGCHLGSTYDGPSSDGLKRIRYTGRHWWGSTDDRGGVDPLEKEEASAVSSSLGFPERESVDQGTSVMILDPAFDSDDLESLKYEITESILWNFWPRMTDATPDDRTLEVHLDVLGERVALPAPEEFPPLDLFAQAFAAIKRGEDNVTQIKSQRPRKDLGKLGIRKGMRGRRHVCATRDESLIPTQSSHIALMRPVELVVKYLPGEPYPDKRFEWAGVFICSEDPVVENAFASSEPPAHDDWIPNNLPKGHARTYVNVGLRELRQHAYDYAAPEGGPGDNQEAGPSLARTASQLGNFLGKMQGEGSGKRGKTGSVSSPRPYSVTPPEFVRLATMRNSGACAVFRAAVRNDKSHSDLNLVAQGRLMADSGAVSTDDLSADFEPEVLSIRHVPSGEHSEKNSLFLGNKQGDVEITVSMPSEAAVGLKLSLEPRGG